MTKGPPVPPAGSLAMKASPELFGQTNGKSRFGSWKGTQVICSPGLDALSCHSLRSNEKNVTWMNRFQASMQQESHEIWLWNEIRLGNERALRQLYLQCYDALFRSGIHQVADKVRVKESINQAFMEIWLKKERLPNVEKVRAYIYVIFKRALFAGLKQERAVYAMLDEENVMNTVLLQQHSYEDMLIAMQSEEELQQRMLRALEKLSPRQKELIRLRYYENLELVEVSRRTGISRRTIYNTLHTAITVLRRELQ